MTAAIGPGSEVRCVDARPHASTGETLLVVGRIYRVAALYRMGVFAELILEGMPTYGWEPDRFEPIDRRSFDHLLNVTEPVKEVA